MFVYILLFLQKYISKMGRWREKSQRRSCDLFSVEWIFVEF